MSKSVRFKFLAVCLILSAYFIAFAWKLVFLLLYYFEKNKDPLLFPKEALAGTLLLASILFLTIKRKKGGRLILLVTSAVGTCTALYDLYVILSMEFYPNLFVTLINLILFSALLFLLTRKDVAALFE